MLNKYLRSNAVCEDLIYGEIDDEAYADKSKHACIMIIERAVKDLHVAFDPLFDAKKGIYHQRLTYAVRMKQTWGGTANVKFRKAFVEACAQNGTKVAVDGKYQQRYEIFREVSKQVPGGLDRGFSWDQELTDPTKDEIDSYTRRLLYGGSCGNRDDPDCIYFCRPTGEGKLMLCSKCNVVRYCSREC